MNKRMPRVKFINKREYDEYIRNLELIKSCKRMKKCSGEGYICSPILLKCIWKWDSKASENFYLVIKFPDLPMRTLLFEALRSFGVTKDVIMLIVFELRFQRFLGSKEWESRTLRYFDINEKFPTHMR